MHTFYQMDNGGCIAFFEEPHTPFEFKEQRDFDLHLALEVDYQTLERMMQKAQTEAISYRGPSDHDFIHSIYFRDPNGYVVELAATPPDKQGNGFDPSRAKDLLAQWQQEKQAS